MKRQIQKTTGLKDPPVYNLRSRVRETEGSKDSSPYNSCKIQKTESPKDPPAYISSKVHKTEVSKDSLVDTQKSEIQKNKGQKASKVAIQRIPKTDGSKDSAVIQKRVSPIATIQNTAAPKKTVTVKTSTPAVVAHNNEKKPCYLYYIKQDEFAGHEKECEPSGHICIICHKDLFDVPQDDDDDDGGGGSHEDDEYDDELEEYDLVSRHLLPAADVLPCGHAFHTECFNDHALKTKSGDPRCILCLQKL